MINRYRSVNVREISAPTLQSVTTAKNITNVATILQANKQIDEYQFAVDDELTKALAGCSVSVWSEKADNKRGFVNKGTILLNGSKYFASIFGVKDAPVNKKDYSVDESKSLKFGYCKSGGELVGSIKVNPVTGATEFIPTIYVNLA